MMDGEKRSPAFRRTLLALGATAGLLAAAGGVAAGAAPPGVPDLKDPEVRSRFVLRDMFRLDEDPDFPVLVLAGVEEGAPPLLVMIVDARNGKETWSLREDAAVFFLVMADPSRLEQAYLDEGFAAGGKASGRFIAEGPERAADLVARLRERCGRTPEPASQRRAAI